MKKPRRLTAEFEEKQGFFSRNKYLFLAFAMPFVLMSAAFAFAGVSPFGTNQILVTDLWHQYYPFLVDLQNKLKEGGSLLYTWSIGLGENYPALMSYYLASPLNFLSVLVPSQFLREYLAFSVAFKIGFAGFSFAYFLRSTYRRNDISIAFFSGLFALCAFFMGYYWNVIWLDTTAILPLVVAGFLALQTNGKYKLYIITLALSVLMNYYIGLFTCIFILLCYICYNICCCRSLKSFGKNFWRIAWTTLVALSITAILTVPAFLALQNTYSAVNKFPESYAINIGSTNDLAGTIDAIRQVISNCIAFTEPTAKTGLPNIYCGMISVFLAFLFLFSRKIKLKEKIVNVALLVFFIMSFIIRQLDYIWHGFHFTNMIPYRFSFLFSFVLVAMAYRAYITIDSFSVFDALLALILSSMVIVSALFIKSTQAIVISAIIVLLCFVTVFLYTRKMLNKRFLTAAFCLIVAAEMTCSVIQGVNTVAVTTATDYPRGGEDTEAVITEMNNLEEDTVDLWRSEFTKTQTLNDGALNGTVGVSAFSSMLNVNITKFLEEFGLAGWQSGNRYCYYESSPVTNLFLNLKYIISRDGNYGNTDYLKEVYSSGAVKLLKNTAYLPMGFVTDSALADYYEVGDYPNNPIAAQNYFFRLATGLDKDVYRELEVVSQGHTSSDLLTVSKKSSGVYSFHTNDSEVEPHLKYNFIVPDDVSQETMICFYISVTNVTDLTLMKNDQEIGDYYIKRGYIGCAGGFEAGDKISLYVDLDREASGSAYVRCACFNSDVFDEGLDILSQSVMKCETVRDTLIEGTIDVRQDGLFYTSIPYEDGWSVYLDGKEVEVTPVGNAMLAFPISSGTHTVKLKYVPKGFVPGVFISLTGILVLFLCIIVEKIRKKPLMPRLNDIPPGLVSGKIGGSSESGNGTLSG